MVLWLGAFVVLAWPYLMFEVTRVKIFLFIFFYLRRFPPVAIGSCFCLFLHNMKMKKHKKDPSYLF